MQVVKLKSRPKSLGLILPVYNEAGSLPKMCDALLQILPKMQSGISVEACFVNNGSTDESLEILLNYDFGTMPVGILSLSRNYGYESALVAGLNFTNFDVYSLVDADGEDPVEILPSFLDQILSGEDLVLGIRGMRHESKFTQVFRRLSYLFLSKVSDEPFTPNSGNFSMFRKNVRDAILVENKVYPFLRATLSRVGLSPKKIAHDRNPRIDGRSKHRHISLYRFAILGFMTSTTWPLRFISYISAFLVSLGALNFLLFRIIFQNKGGGLIDFDALFNLFVLIAISIIGLYLARVYKYTIGRPLYYVDWSNSYESNGFQFHAPENQSND